MKTKIVSLLLALGLTTNAAIAGNTAELGLASDNFYRGAQKSEGSIQSSLRLSDSLGGFNASLHVCSFQAIDVGVDSYNMGGGLSKSFAEELLSVYAGFNHFEDVPGEALSEGEIRLSSNVLLNPSVSIYRDLDESLYTFELSVGHSLETDVADVSLSASIGNTEATTTSDRDYYSVSGAASKDLSESTELSLGVDYVDADNIDGEFVLGSALTFKF
jgi:hypothetical protein